MEGVTVVLLIDSFLLFVAVMAAHVLISPVFCSDNILTGKHHIVFMTPEIWILNRHGKKTR